MRRAVWRIGPATAMVACSGFLAATLENEATFWGFLGSGALGFAWHWSISRTNGSRD